MRVDFEGLSTHALQLFQNFGKTVGLSKNFRLIANAILARLPELKYASCCIQITPSPRFLQKPKKESAEPTMVIKTSETQAVLSFCDVSKESDRERLLALIVGKMMLRKSKTEFALVPESVFKAFPSLSADELHFTEHEGLEDRVSEKSGMHIEIDVTRGVHNSFRGLIVRVNEPNWHDKAYAFAQDLAPIVPNVNITYSAKADHKEWEGSETIQDAIEWNWGSPYIRTARQRQERAVLKEKVEPFKPYFDTYLEALGYCRANQGHILYRNVKEALSKGLTHPTLVIHLSMALHADDKFPSVYRIGKEEEAEQGPFVGKIPVKVETVMMDSIKSRIGYPKGTDNGKDYLPSDQDVRLVVLELFRNWRNPDQLKAVHDRFAKKFPLKLYTHLGILSVTY